MLITSDGVLIRTESSEISTYGRQTQGVKIMRLDDGVKLVSMAKTPHEDEEENTEASEEADASQNVSTDTDSE